MFSRKKENPLFHNWTLVYVPYCDGASFTGDQAVSAWAIAGVVWGGQNLMRFVDLSCVLVLLVVYSVFCFCSF